MGILSTQRNEATNNVCHGISKATSTITDCFLGLEKVMMTWRRNELDEDFKCTQSEIVPIVKSSPILRQASKFYSRKIYNLFEGEFLNGIGGLSLQQSLDDSKEFIVKSLDLQDDGKAWNVRFSLEEGTILCSCRKFETMGILCCHSIRVLSQCDVVSIPRQYLLPRWSCRAKKELYGSKTPPYTENRRKDHDEKSTGLVFRNRVSRHAYEISTRAQGNAEAEEYMIKFLTKLSSDVDSILNGEPITQPQRSKRKAPAADANQFEVKNPAKVRPKGVSNARLKGFWEKGRRRKGNI